ncbi:hypothetical protein GGI12_001412 [Dipsacomyces acuminosporus]|nr:hypothetical protein GGI12_001412 [Dipsacomyces acuminosporus]
MNVQARSNVEFEYVKGPKGLQASRVTGPDGAYVRGDPYIRNRPRIPNTLRSASSTPGSYYSYGHHYAGNYSQLMTYTSPLAQPHYSSFPYATATPPSAFVLPPVNAAVLADSHVLVGSSATSATGSSTQMPLPLPPPHIQFINASAHPVPQHHIQPLPPPYTSGQPATVPVYESALNHQQQQPLPPPPPNAAVCNMPMPRPSSPPGFSSSNRKDSASSQISAKQYGAFSE